MEFEIVLDEIHEHPCSIKFDPPLKLECFGCDKDTDYVLVAYDFGMSVDFPVTLENNMLMLDNDTVEDIVRKTAIFDLFHAFFHYNLDPNYTVYHWALYGNLKERAILTEDEDEI